jgi:hypothetical protein
VDSLIRDNYVYFKETIHQTCKLLLSMIEGDAGCAGDDDGDDDKNDVDVKTEGFGESDPTLPAAPAEFGTGDATAAVPAAGDALTEKV